ncbi:MAG: RHS repeat-associated core domain-containing protein [Acidobacteriota bacterium]
MSASSFAFPWPRLRRRIAGLLCWALLLQAAPGLAESVRWRSEPRGWPVVAGKIRAAADRARDTWREVAGASRWMRSRVSEASDSFLLLFDEPVAADPGPPSTPPSPPGFSGAPAVSPGWNLISLSTEPVDPSPQAVFAPLGAALRQVFAYDACDTADPWKVYDPADPAASDLTSVDERPGLWIEASQSAGLPSTESAAPSSTIHLCPGWNLIGFPSDQSRPVASALSSIAGKYQRVFGYEASDAADPWELYDVSVPAWVNDLQVLRPGHGYWILATAEADLRIVNDGSDFGVEIAQPAQLAEVTEPVEVTGTVRGQSLAEWELRYRSLDGGDWVTIGAGTGPVTGGRLGTFDPTLLLNGLYEIELSALAADGDGVSYSTHVVVEGQQKIGNFTVSFVDLEVPLAGIPIQVVRTYDSREKRSLDFGHGWTLEVRQGSYRNNRTPGEGWRIVDGLLPCQTVQETLPHLTTVRLSEREIYRFRLALTRPAVTAGGCFAEAGFAFVDGPVPGATLEILGNTSVFHGNGTTGVVDAESQEPYEPDGVRLRTRDGRIFDLDLAQGLTRLADLNGNELQISASGITHSSGRSLAFTRDSRGRITDIADPLDRTIHYEYDAAGDLIAVTDRENQTTRFTYDGTHGLLAIQDPRGIQPLRNEYDDEGRLLRHIDAFGRTIELGHDLANHREVITDRLGHSRSLEYDARGNVVKETDALGNVATRTFDSRDALLSETDPLGHTTSYTYDADRNLASVRDPLGHTIHYTYNARGQVATTTDPRGKTTRLDYDGAGNLVRTADPLGNVTAYSYDDRGNLLTRTDAGQAVTAYAYDDAGNLASVTDPLGTVTSCTYDSDGNRLSQRTTRTRADGAEEELVRTFEYDAMGRLTKITDPDGTVGRTLYDALGNVAETIDKLGRRTVFTYDDMGRQTAVEHPDATRETKLYDAEGRLLASMDRAGRTTRFTHDAAGRLLTTTYPDTAVAANAYDDAGRLVSTTDARGNTTAHTYDAAGRRIRSRDALGHEASVTYDDAGNQASITDARNHTTSFEHDDAGRLVRVLFPDGTSRQTGYDAAGQRAFETDQAGVTTRFGYDPAGRLLTVTDALGQVTRFAYDEPGNRISQSDANGHETRFEHDRMGRLVRRVLPDGASETLGYDALGNLVRRQDFKGTVTTWAYDEANRLLSRSSSSGSGGSSASFTYTASGQRETAVDARGTTRYAYDSRDRLTALTYPDGRQLAYTYDLQGNRTSLVAQLGSTRLATVYTYDALNRLATVTDPQARVYAYDYDGNGNRTGLSYPNGTATAFGYDPLNRLTDLTTKTAADTVVQAYAYTLGPAGNRTRIDEVDGTVRSYGYDALYRLTGDVVARAGVPVYSRSFAYDAVGNRLRQTHTGEDQGIVTTDYAYDSRDRLTLEGARASTWDANGNRTARTGEATYAWDSEDRLQSVTLADGRVVLHTYDADGVLVRTETRAPDGTAKVTDYLVDTSGPLSQIVAESAGGALAAFYVRGDDLLATMRPASGGAWESRFHHADGLGSIRALTDDTGTVTDRYAYTAFGELISHTGADANTFRFAGETQETVSGLYSLRARWLSPGDATFVSMDPLPGRSGDPRSLHKYLYAGADPLNRVDPGGLEYSLAGMMAAGGVMSTLTTWVNSRILQTPFTAYDAASSFLLGAATTALVVGVGLGIAAGVGVSRGVGLLISATAANSIAAAAGVRAYLTAESGRERAVAAIALVASVAGLLLGARAYQKYGAGRGLFVNEDPSASPGEIQLGRWLADKMALDIVRQAPQGPRGPNTADFRVAFSGRTLELKNLQNSSLRNVVSEITHAQSDNVVVVLRPDQFSPGEISSLAGRVFSPNAPGSPKNSIQIIFENPDGGFVLGDFMRRWGT